VSISGGGARGGAAGRTLLSQQEVADRLGVSRHTVMRLERDGLLTRAPGVGRPRYPEQDVARLAGERSRARSPADLREALLDEAAAVTARDGAQACTIAAVAGGAGVTTGAVLHHFPHKEDLLRGLVEAFVHRFEARWQTERSPGRGPAEAYVAATLDGPEPLSAALLACASYDPALLAPLGERVRSWYAELGGEGPDAVRRCLAADALWLFALFGMQPVDDPAGLGLGLGLPPTTGRD
jgi:AcrR family transcriptional regulator